MDEEKFEKTYWIGIVVNCVLTIVGVVGVVFQICRIPDAFQLYIVLAELILVFYYVVAGYKKPHGNLFRYLMWGFVLFMLFELNASIEQSAQVPVILCVFSIIFTSYLSGRLNKFKQNQVICALVFLMGLAINIIRSTGASMMSGGLPPEGLPPEGLAPAGMPPAGVPPEGMGGADIGISGIIFNFTSSILWIDLMFSYVVRYHMHKEAGFESK